MADDLSKQLRVAARKGDTRAVIALLDAGANTEAAAAVSFSFSDSFSVWFAHSSTLALILTGT